MTATEPAPEMTYLWHALVHPIHLLLALSVCSMALMSTAWALLLLPLVALPTVVLMSRMECFRREVDRERHDAMWARYESDKNQVLVLMSAEHRAEFSRLETLVRGMYERADGAASAHLVLSEHLRLPDLLASYAQLALSHRQAVRNLQLTCHSDPDVELSRIDRDTPSRFAHARETLLQKRRIAREQAEQRLEEIEAEMATIADLIRLAHERRAAAADHDERFDGDRIDVYLQELERYDEAIVDTEACI